jgi:hypothetical protein
VLAHIPVNAVANSAFRNKGGLQFSDAAKEWGLADPSFSNGAAYADLDRDGDLDLIVNNENAEAFVYRNRSREQTANNYIGIQLRAAAPNLFAIGSKIKVFRSDQVFLP